MLADITILDIIIFLLKCVAAIAILVAIPMALFAGYALLHGGLMSVVEAGDKAEKALARMSKSKRSRVLLAVWICPLIPVGLLSRDVAILVMFYILWSAVFAIVAGVLSREADRKPRETN